MSKYKEWKEKHYKNGMCWGCCGDGFPCFAKFKLRHWYKHHRKETRKS